MGNTKADEMTERLVRLSGEVVRETVDRGSKSERRAVVLKADDGNSYVLRKQNGPAFGDTGLEPLVGSSIDADGITIGKTLIMRNWSIRNDPSN